MLSHRTSASPASALRGRPSAQVPPAAGRRRSAAVPGTVEPAGARTGDGVGGEGRCSGSAPRRAARRWGPAGPARGRDVGRGAGRIATARRCRRGARTAGGCSGGVEREEVPVESEDEELVDAGVEAAAISAAGIRTAIRSVSSSKSTHQRAVSCSSTSPSTRTLQVGGRADVQPVGDLRGPGAEHLGAVATSDDEPSPRQGDRPRGHRPLGVPTGRGREHRARRPVELVEAERRQRLDGPHGPRRLDGAAQVDPGDVGRASGSRRGEPRPPVGLSRRCARRR